MGRRVERGVLLLVLGPMGELRCGLMAQGSCAHSGRGSLGTGGPGVPPRAVTGCPVGAGASRMPVCPGPSVRAEGSCPPIPGDPFLSPGSGGDVRGFAVFDLTSSHDVGVGVGFGIGIASQGCSIPNPIATPTPRGFCAPLSGCGDRLGRGPRVGLVPRPTRIGELWWCTGGRGVDGSV